MGEGDQETQVSDERWWIAYLFLFQIEGGEWMPQSKLQLHCNHWRSTTARVRHKWTGGFCLH
jgi:hypothetical protein